MGNAIRLFCESGSMNTGGEEVLHLPTIVEAAESSPSAAAAAAQQIRKFLSKDWAAKPHVQYNSIMLIRILSDNPGPSFTRNFDKPFVSTIKEALRNCKDASTQQILRETLDSLEANKQFQEGMELLIQMWRKEKGNQARLSQGYSTSSQAAPGFGPQNPYQYRNPTRSGGHEERHHSSPRNRQLPPPVELASRIEEAKNTAKILLQLIQSTPSEEILNNDLIREFAERCQSAQRSMQGYINCDTPPPDDDTMLTLIETNEQLSLATTRYQRSVLNARRALGISPSPNAGTTETMSGPYAPPAAPPPTQNQNMFASNSPQQPNESAFGSRDESYQPPMGPPPGRTGTNDSAFSSRNESYQPPMGPPPARKATDSSFNNPNESYEAPPGPPPAMLARLNSREGQSPTHPRSPVSPNRPPQAPALDQPSDPFADPIEHDRNAAPLAYDSANNVAAHPAHRPHSQTFSIDAEPQYAPGTILSASSNQNERPGLSTTFAGATPSYMGRQASAANGLTMHGAQNTTISEIDGHSEVGRTAGNEGGRSNSVGSDDPYSVSPVEVRTAQGTYRY